jgi:hypothetical protein
MCRHPLAFLFLLSGTIVLHSWGCMAVHYPPVGKLDAPGVVITAEDQSFEIKAGELFKTPFHLKNGRPQNTWGTSPDCLAVPTLNPPGARFALKRHLRIGAKRVRIRYPGVAEPLYGVLAFCGVWAHDGAATRSYLLRITPEDVAATRDGAMRVMFESTNFVTHSTTGRTLAWVLWMSRIPFR